MTTIHISSVQQLNEICATLNETQDTTYTFDFPDVGCDVPLFLKPYKNAITGEVSLTTFYFCFEKDFIPSYTEFLITNDHDYNPEFTYDIEQSRMLMHSLEKHIPL